jgi:DNA-binding response OmpR family regulator
MQNKFLLIGDNLESSWSVSVSDALCELGVLKIYSAADAGEQIGDPDVQMVIVDAGAVAGLTPLIVRLRQLSPTVPIVIASASPTWQTAKEVLLIGANDCIRKSLDPEKLRAAFQEVLIRSRH